MHALWCWRESASLSLCPARSGLAALAGARYLSPTPDASSEVAASEVQLRTMSRIERIPTTSAPSTTMMCRKPPRTISLAACSSDQSGAARITSAVRCSRTRSSSGASSRPIGAQDVPFGDDAWPGLLLVDHDGGADAACGHSSSGLPQGVVGSGRDDNSGHRVAYVHDASFVVRNK